MIEMIKKQYNCVYLERVNKAQISFSLNVTEEQVLIPQSNHIKKSSSKKWQTLFFIFLIVNVN